MFRLYEQDDVIGRLTEREDLPQEDPVGPHVTLGRVQRLEDTLGRHPLHGQTSL